jgi:hypothetical protein
LTTGVGVRRCEFCSAVYVQWLQCRDGRRRLFNADPVEVGQLPDDAVGWVPGRVKVRGRERVALAPISQVSSGKADAARRVMVVHDCPEFTRLYQAAMGEPR